MVTTSKARVTSSAASKPTIHAKQKNSIKTTISRKRSTSDDPVDEDERDSRDVIDERCDDGDREGSEETTAAASSVAGQQHVKKRRAPPKLPSRKSNESGAAATTSNKNTGEPSAPSASYPSLAAGSFELPQSNIINNNNDYQPLTDNLMSMGSFGLPGGDVGGADLIGEVSATMNQDQAWEILNQDSFGFTLGQGTLGLSFSNDQGDDEMLALPPTHADGIGGNISGGFDAMMMDGNNDDMKGRGKSMDLTSAVTESVDDPCTPGKNKMSTVFPQYHYHHHHRGGAAAAAKRNPFYPHDDTTMHHGPGYVPPTPPSTHSAPAMASSSSALYSSSGRKREPRDDRHRNVDYSSSAYHKEYYYDRPRHVSRSSGGKRSGTRSSSRRHQRYCSGEMGSGSPPPLPNIESAPSPSGRAIMQSSSWGGSPEEKRYKSSRHSSSRDRRLRDGYGSRHPGPPPSWINGSGGPIRPSARYPKSPSHGRPSQVMPSHPSHGYHYGEFLPPQFSAPQPVSSGVKSSSCSNNAPPREVFIMPSSPAPTSSSPPYHRHSQRSGDRNGHGPSPLPEPHRTPYYPPHPSQYHNRQGMPPLPASSGGPLTAPQSGAALLGSLTREQAPGIGWPPEEDIVLTNCMSNQKSPVDWEVIARDHGKGRNARECHDRWTRYLKPGARKGQWREEEDAIVLRVIAQSSEHPFTQWADLAPQLPGRSGKQIRDRWVNYLNPAINHLPFSRVDDLNLWEGHKELGKRWVEISVKVFNSTRSENHIKNRWYSAAFKKFIATEFGPNAYVKVGSDK